MGDARRQSRASPLLGEKGKLCKEIQDEFLICKICLETLKAPKCLSCLHTFCEACVEKHVLAEYAAKKYGDYREFNCPLCRKRTTLPIGGVKRLPDNFLVSNLSDMVNRSKTSEQGACDICPSSARRRTAVSKCLECHKLLCKECVELHRQTRVTREHALFDVDNENDVYCKEHEDEVVRFYCEPCQTCVCVVCTFNTHREHEVASFGESAARHKAQVRGLLNECKNRATELEACLDSLARVEKDIKETEQQVRDLAIEFVSAVRQRERQLVEELQSSYGEEALAFLAKRAEYQALLDNLRSSCSLSEVVVRGKDLDFLLLKRSVQDKLRQAERIQPLLEIPSSLTRQVRFLPGGFELGWLQEDGQVRRAKYPSRRCSFSQRLQFVGSMDTIDSCTQTIDSGAPFASRSCQTESNAFAQSREVQTFRAVCLSLATQTDASFLAEKAVNTTIRMVQSAQVTKVLTATAVPATREEVESVVKVAVAVTSPPPVIQGPVEPSEPQDEPKDEAQPVKEDTPALTGATCGEEGETRHRCHKHHHKHHHHHHKHHHHRHHRCHHRQRREAAMATLEENKSLE